MNDNIKKMLERQANWQKARKAESWAEKLAKSAAARKSLTAYKDKGMGKSQEQT